MNPGFKKYLLDTTKSSDCEEVDVIQSLWSGYGNIVRYALIDSSLKTVVVKHIALNKSNDHPRGWNTSFAHQRKITSYEVETYWYRHWNQKCHLHCRVPEFLGAYSEGKDQWIVLEDLDVHFPFRKHHLRLDEVKLCLKWLAHFHARFMHQKPEGLWDVGTYWHLGTRPDEYEKIEHQKLKTKAQAIDAALHNCTYQTIVHGDAKLANFCFSKDGKSVAAVDFQYVGGGCGMKDVAYFLGSCLTGDECEIHEAVLLEYYFTELQSALQKLSLEIDFTALKDEWTWLYPIACTDFTRFLLGWMPSHQKINRYNLNLMKKVLAEL